MPNRHYPPAYLRYLKARLLNLGRPSFWVTAIFLSVIGLVTWEYWSNPNIFVSKQKTPATSQKPADSSLSEENKAIAADIDNLPALFNDFEQAPLSLTANTPQEKTEAKNSKGLLEDAIKKQNSASDSKLNPGLGVNTDTSPAMKNPFVVQTENLLRAGTVNSNNQFLGIKTLNAASEPTEGQQTSSSLSIGLTNQTNKNQNTLPVSPLQSALNQSTNQKLSSFNGSATRTNASSQVSEAGTTLMPPINSLPSQSLPSTGLTTGGRYTSTGTNLPQNPDNTIYTNLNGGQVVPGSGSTGTNLPQNPDNTIYTNLNGGQVVPNIAPVTPPFTSTAPNNLVPYSSPSQGVVNPTNPVGYGNYGLQQPTQHPQSNYGNYGLQQPTQQPQSNYGNYILQQPTQSNSLYLRQIRDKYRSPGQN
ncbi:hypothetical protein ANSO36C_10060 [Nostoc cf. commune SO-36]|uniref:Uncharacterized protein n=1 Tax=Nostoc cf. commune SO-36 TaxID=449208 RepID=A0ABM7YX26_NOSCO|nr:hypothetical protein [Nostoc commune]BDI15204.1 hypothetical protein ANSO36C_10060 [Nostoc cf. commune SO-36]